MLPALREIGVDIDMDDIFIEGTELILRAICARSAAGKEPGTAALDGSDRRPQPGVP